MKSWRIVQFCVQLGRFTRALWNGKLVMNERGEIHAVNVTVGEIASSSGNISHLPIRKFKLKGGKRSPEVAELVVAADSKSAG
ncbi:hypothetical protein [Xanthomonas phage RTH11]|nr:hypothetical protein [Xanthomonas phage RTH11]